ncbi:undecaprenyl-diphosphatase [Candidatus Kinetoplastibacterium blastocrithidii TCC012E]|uniref:Undecaprenyl-diphosphatase n=1 Tax=Candidatus Kinetoplastidibacterium blastocrithidiae TCC012E TaxID=1208922 RepID=M1LVM2_9PROT|nr:undecaprenyl-diphosphate phosphatase [Candidatus Kinetoplastibacterium blastocrithidii]AFZ83505.1 undecaprenyl pyrophosphate phosphatase [Candidatus Kinetoplastibacterium blastocrithidii (ex Strigomonas culicis)]AGF49602.1 undecaprenyl-diphosphatase [Candidatus Kinetoplastibacterium blastocrithidii TCC012E]
MIVNEVINTDQFLVLIKACFLGIVEGFTEFIPVSSTAHLIFIGKLISFDSCNGMVFEVFIQVGAIFSAIFLFRFYIVEILCGVIRLDARYLLFSAKIICSTLPSVIIGALLIRHIKKLFLCPNIMALSLIIGGFIIIIVEYRKNINHEKTLSHYTEMYNISIKQSLYIGFAQCIAMIPGVSRFGATVIGGMLSGLSRSIATRYSFIIAIPTMLGAALYDLWSNIDNLSYVDFSNIFIGSLSAFVSAFFIVKYIVRFVETNTYIAFALYRIAVGFAVLFLN